MHWDDHFGVISSEFNLDLSPSSQLGYYATQYGPDGLVYALNVVLMHGTMSTEMSSTIVAAVSGLDIGTMVRNAVFLVVTSPQYRVML